MAMATITFDLDNPEDRMAHMRCVKSTDMAIVLFEISYNLKKKCERICDSMEVDGNQPDGVHTTFQEISELLYDRGINLDELIE